MGNGDTLEEAGQDKGIKLREDKTESKCKTGDYYLLVIAVDNYDESSAKNKLSPLDNPVLEVNRLIALLTDQYTFAKPGENSIPTPGETDEIIILSIEKTKCLYNNLATSANIKAYLYGLASEMKEDDNLLIYFSGHGFSEKKNGYIIPFDGENNMATKSNWINTKSLVFDFDDFTANNKCRHLLIILDCCYAGGGFLGMQGNRSDLIFSRHILTSSFNEPAKDGQFQVGSPFSVILLDYLSQNTKGELQIEEDKLRYKFHSYTKGKNKQDITYETMSCNEIGRGAFTFRLLDQEKPRLEVLTDTIVDHLNFEEERGNLKKSYKKRKNNLNIITSCSPSCDAQQLLAKIMFRWLKDKKRLDDHSEFLLLVEASMDASCTQDIWELLFTHFSDGQASDSDKTNYVVDYILDRLKSDEEQDSCAQHGIIWISIQTGGPELMQSVVDFCATFKELFLNKQNASIQKDNASFRKLFFFFSDEREHTGQIFKSDFKKQVNDSDVNLILNDEPSGYVNNYDIEEWIAEAAERVKLKKFQEMEERIFRPSPLEEEYDYAIPDFVDRVLNHCGYLKNEKMQLYSQLYDFTKKIS